jgi:hypothetical protein
MSQRTAFCILGLALCGPLTAAAMPELPREPLRAPEPRIVAPHLENPIIRRRRAKPADHRHDEKADTPDAGGGDGGDDCHAKPLQPACGHVHRTPAQMRLLMRRNRPKTPTSAPATRP